MSCKEKPYLTYQQQIERLADKGIKCEKANEKKALVRKGYFNLINGYKRPFIIKRDDSGEHTYHPDTSVEKLFKVLKFDRRVSSMLLRNITHIEEEIRSISAYFFDQINEEAIYWDNPDAYDSLIEKEKVLKLIRDIKNDIKIAKANHNEYINHYDQKYALYPTWIMTKVIKFTTFITFLKLSKKEVKIKVCELYDIEYNSKVNEFKVLFAALNWMRKTRNACAHNERIIFYQDYIHVAISKYHRLLTNFYTRRRKKQIVDVLLYMKYFNTKREYQKLINFLKKELKDMKHVVGDYAFDQIRASLGIKQIKHLDRINNLPKEIQYSKLI